MLHHIQDEKHEGTASTGILKRLKMKDFKKLKIPFNKGLVVRPEELMKEEFMYEEQEGNFTNK